MAFTSDHIIGPYKLVRRIGKGAFGVVWLAEKQSALATTSVAIKIPDNDAVDLDAVKREAAVWVSASGHPNVLPIIDADVYDEHVVIVSEYAPDGTLAGWLESHGGRASSTEDALEMMLGITAGLDHLHRRGIIHRDLKPENILLQGETPRLADFGIARVLKGTSHTAAASGTPLYMPPEAFDGKRGEFTDIWSAGVIFYQLISGRLPFNGEGLTALLGSIISKDPEPVPGCPPHIWAVIEKALAKDPAARFASAAEMRRSLRRGGLVASEDPTRTFDPDISMHPTIKAIEANTRKQEVQATAETVGKNRPAIWYALAGVLAIAAVIGALYLYNTKGNSRQHSEAQFAEMFRTKASSWSQVVFSAQGQNGGIHEINASEDTAQVWSTAQCLAAVLESHDDVTAYADKIKRGFEFIERSRRTDPSPGWNYYGNSNPFTVTEVAGWVVVAQILAIDNSALGLPEAERQQYVTRIARDLDEIVQRQDKSGGWRPIRDDQPGFTRTYASTIALWSLLEARGSPAFSRVMGTRYDENIRRGINWFLLNHKNGLGWFPNPNRPGQAGRFDGLNAQILFVLSRAESMEAFASLKFEPTYVAAKKDFIATRDLAKRENDKNNSNVPDVDIRFANTEFMAEGSTFIWFPWTLAALSQLVRDESLTPTDRTAAAELRADILDHNFERLNGPIERDGLMYIYAENLFCGNVYLESLRQH